MLRRSLRGRGGTAARGLQEAPLGGLGLGLCLLLRRGLAGAQAGASGAPPPQGRGRTYYDILSVPRRARQEEVKEAYRRLAKRYHPDRNADDPEAETRFKEVQEAYATLSEPFKRALYEQDLQFSSYGSAVTREVERDTWTEHWDKETPEEREARKERYRRYATGERNDLPPDHFPLRWTPVLMLLPVGVIFYVCVRAPDWFDLQSDPSFCDPAFDDTSVPLVPAFHDPVMNRWERLPEGAEPPTPEELYARYRCERPDLMERLDLRLLPKVHLTALHVPRTEAARPARPSAPPPARAAGEAAAAWPARPGAPLAGAAAAPTGALL